MSSPLQFAEDFMASTPLPSILSPWTLLGLALLPIGLWLYTALIAPHSFPTLSNSRILLLIAHPDDEAMFFSPTLLQLTNPKLNNHIKLLCLSAGDADGLGHVRINELRESAKLLGIQQEKDVFCLDVPELRDGMKEKWDERVIAELLMHTFVESSATTTKKEKSSKERERSKEKDRDREKEREKEKERERRHVRSPSGTSSDAKLKRTPSNSTASSGGSSKRREISMSSKSNGDAQSTSSGSTFSSSSTTTSKRPSIFSSLSSSKTKTTSSTSSPTSPTSPSSTTSKSSTKLSTPPSPNLDVILTFDKHGISGHPNHAACNAGATLFIRRLIKSAGPGWACPVHLYTLTSINMLRKYSWVYDVILSVVLGLAKIVRRSGRKAGARDGYASWLLFISGVGGYGKARQAMHSAHKSQMRWFRWGWIGIGRYMVVNDLRRVDIR